MKLYAVYGVSGFGREVMPVARAMLTNTFPLASYELVFVDDAPDQRVVNGHRVLTLEEFGDEPACEKFISIAIADSATRQQLSLRCEKLGVNSYSVIAPNSMVLDSNQIGEGAILCPHTMVTSNARIGRFFHANIYSYVAHDCVIGDFVTFAPSVQCNGNVTVEDHAYIGTNATIRQGAPGKPLVIGRGATVGMGAVVTKDVPPGATVIGNPARLLNR